MNLLPLFQQLQATPVGEGLRQSEVVFPLVETAHVLALALSVGTVMWFDLRLLGVAMRHDPVSAVFARLKAWMLAGFAVMFVTGGLMFWALAGDLYGSGPFRVKVALLGLAGLNILVYHLTVDRDRARWDRDPVPPAGARLAGALSLALWLGVIAAGRFTAYGI